MQRCCIHKTYLNRSIYDSINICIHSVQFVHCLYVQKTYKGRFSQLLKQILSSLYIICMYKKHAKVVSVSQLYRFCIVCTLFACTKNIHFKFQVVFILNISPVFYILYMYRKLMYIFCAIIIKQYFDLYNLCIQNIYKLSFLYNFCIHFVKFLHNFF